MTKTANLGIYYPRAINDKGQMVGTAQDYLDSKFLFFDGLQTTDLDITRTETKSAAGHDLNNAGVIVGGLFLDSGQGLYIHPVYYKDGVFNEIFSTSIRQSMKAFFTCVNDFGHAAGHGDQLPGTVGGKYGFVYKDGEMTLLGNLGDQFVEVTGINNSDQIVGRSFVESFGDIHAFIWQDGVMKDMGTPAGLFSGALAINDAGVAVGKMDSPDDDVLQDPKLWLYNGSQPVMGNDNWGKAANMPLLSGTMKRIGAFDLADGSKDAALIIQLEPGHYSMVVEGADGGQGVALMEVYLVPPAQ
ncbi:MAG: hypothetical protein WC378_13805 [Opitutaceae bacterium]|jgi:probable HAF family extracellular repeat protein